MRRGVAQFEVEPFLNQIFEGLRQATPYYFVLYVDHYR
jgi:hypothetical protein